MAWLRSIFYPLTGLAVLQVIYSYPQLPTVVAAHFDGRGTPDGWSGKDAFFALYLVIVVLLVSVFAWLPRRLQSRPGERLKIPNRDYWMSAERRTESRAFFRRQMLLVGIAHLCLAIYVVQLAILANFAEPPRLHASITCTLAAYLVFVAAWLLHFLLHFKRP